MKYNKYLVLLIALISILQGCAIDLKMKKVELQSKSPLGEIKPLTILVGEFEDEIPVKDEDKDAIGYAGARKIVLNKNKKVADIVSEAISNELKRNGHNVINSVGDNTSADLIIKGCVSRCGYVSVPEGMWRVKFNTIMELKVVYISGYSNKTLSRTYNGSMTRTWVWATMKDVKELIEIAFSNMVEEFATDPEVLDMLKELEKAKYKM